MRRIVRDYVLDSLHLQKADLERFIAEHLEVGDAFPLILSEPTVAFQETRGLKIVPRFNGDFPEVDLTASLRVAITATAERREAARGVRTTAVPNEYLGRHTFAIDVEVKAVGLPTGRGYEIKPQRARLRAWWGRSERNQPSLEAYAYQHLG